MKFVPFRAHRGRTTHHEQFGALLATTHYWKSLRRGVYHSIPEVDEICQD